MGNCLGNKNVKTLGAAEQHFEIVFGTSLESFVIDGILNLDGKCDTEEKLKAVARVLAINVEIDGWNGILDLSGNGIVNIDVIGQALETNNTLKELSLSFNQIVDIDAIGKALETNNTLNALNLSYNQIVDIDAIGKALETSNTLTLLYLQGNLIVNIDTIGKALETNDTLNALDLSGDQIVDANKQKLDSIWNNRGRLHI